MVVTGMERGVRGGMERRGNWYGEGGGMERRE